MDSIENDFRTLCSKHEITMLFNNVRVLQVPDVSSSTSILYTRLKVKDYKMYSQSSNVPNKPCCVQTLQ